MKDLPNSVGENLGYDFIGGRNETNRPEILNAIGTHLFRNESDKGGVKAPRNYSIGVKLVKKIDKVLFDNVPTLLKKNPQ